MMKTETHIPNDISTMILKRLPVKSLLRFKSVCKSWYCLIKSPYLVSKHLQYQKRNKGRLLLQFENVQNRREIGYISFQDETLASTTYDEVEHIQFNQDLTKIVGPIKGLFCLSNSIDCIVIWNPTTRKYRDLPHVPSPTQVDVSNTARVYYEFGFLGFGLDPLTDDCKVVLFLKPLNYMVYSLFTDSWKQVNPLEYEYKYPMPEFHSDCIYLRGVCYWWNYAFSNITTFDMSNEILGTLQGPDILSDVPHWKTSTTDLALCDDVLVIVSIAIKYSLCSGREIHIWALEQESCWVKRICINTDEFEYVPSRLLKNKDEIILASSKRMGTSQALFVYNHITEETVKEVLPKGNYRGFSSFVYYESLQPVDRRNYMNQTGKESSLSFSEIINEDIH